MRDEGRAFFSPGSYRLAGVLLRKDASPESNETQEWSFGSGSGSVRSASDASGSSGTFATSTGASLRVALPQLVYRSLFCNGRALQPHWVWFLQLR